MFPKSTKKKNSQSLLPSLCFQRIGSVCSPYSGRRKVCFLSALLLKLFPKRFKCCLFVQWMEHFKKRQGCLSL